MALFNKICLTTKATQVSLSNVYGHGPYSPTRSLSLQLRELCAKLVEDTFLGPNALEPYTIKCTWDPDVQSTTIAQEVDAVNVLLFFNQLKIKTEEITNSFRQLPNKNLYLNSLDITTLHQQLNEIDRVGAQLNVAIFREIRQILQEEISWLNLRRFNNSAILTIPSPTSQLSSPSSPMQQVQIPQLSPMTEVVQMPLNNHAPNNGYFPGLIPVVEASADLNTICNQVEDVCQKIITHTDNIFHYKQISMSSDQNQPFLYQTMQPEYESTVSALVLELKNIISSFVKNVVAVWKNKKQREAIGEAFSTDQSAYHMEQMLLVPFEKIFQAISITIEKLKPVPNDIMNFPNLGYNIFPSSYLFPQGLEIMQIFLSGTFFVIKSPPLVIPHKVFMDNSYVEEPISVSLLVGHSGYHNLNHLQDPVVKMSLITQDQARKIYLHGASAVDEILRSSELGRFENDTAELSIKMDSQYTKLRIAEFTRAKLLGTVRSSKDSAGGSDSCGLVMEQKCCVLFTFSMNILDKSFTVWTTSSPVCVSTHGSQRGLGMAVIIRDYLKAEVNRVPFELPHANPKVISWDELSQVILRLFKDYLEDRELNLTHENWICIKNKVSQAIHPELQRISPEVRDNYYIKNPLENEEIPWKDLTSKTFARLQTVADSQSSNDSLGDKNRFSFWGWLCEAFDVIRSKPYHKDMVTMWKRRVIHGFIEKTTAESYLRAKGVPGTFIVRFSDRLPGAISLAVFGNDKIVHHLNPLSKKDLIGTSLADKLNLFEDLHYIFGLPGSKDDHLREFYARTQNKADGYVDAVSRIGKS